MSGAVARKATGRGTEDEVERAVQYARSKAQVLNNLSDKLGELASRCEQKLWHQLSLAIEEFISTPSVQRVPGLLVDLYHGFIAEFALRLNPLKLVQIAVRVSQQYSQPSDACAFLDGVRALLLESVAPKSATTTSTSDAASSSKSKAERLMREPVLFLEMNVGQLNLQSGNAAKAKEYMDLGLKVLDEIIDADPSVIASVYSLASQYHKTQKNFGEYYKSSLLYLAYVSVESLPPDFRVALAVDVSLAALLGDSIFNYGELLLHPIVQSLAGTDYDWLLALLKCFNKGDIQAYDMVCQRHSRAMGAQPALVEKAEALRAKITLLCLVEHLFSLPPDARSVSLGDIAAHAKLGTVEEAEDLIVRAMAIKQVSGVINQVNGTLEVEWVQPRVLTHEQVEGLSHRLEAWSDKLGATQKHIETL